MLQFFFRLIGITIIIKSNIILSTGLRICRITFVGPRKNSVIADNRKDYTSRVIIERVADDRWHVTHACTTRRFVNKLVAIGSRDNALFTITSWRCILKKHHEYVTQVKKLIFNKILIFLFTRILFNILSKSIETV